MSDLVDRDQEHLRLLQIGYYVMAGITGFYSLFPIPFFLIGMLMLSGALSTGPQRMPDAVAHAFGLTMLIFGAIAFCAGLALAFLQFLTARNLRYHRHR